MGTIQISSVPVAEYAKRVAGLNYFSTVSLDSNIYFKQQVLFHLHPLEEMKTKQPTYSGTVTNIAVAMI